MKYTFLATCCSALLFTLPVSSLNAAPADGIDKTVEWSTLTTWKLPAKPVQFVHSLDGKKVFVLTDNHTILVLTASGELEGTIPVDKGVTSIDIEPYGNRLYLVNSEDNTFIAMSVDKIADVSIGNSPILGPKNAPITITLFTDFECPYCSQVSPIIEKVLEKNPETTKLVLKNLPLRSHKYAEPAARAALAAKEQGKFWEFHDALFAKKGFNLTDIDNIAGQLGLDMAKFKSDMKSNKIKQQLISDIRQAEAAGVGGTPTIFINGRKLKKRSVEGFPTLIDEELAKK